MLWLNMLIQITITSYKNEEISTTLSWVSVSPLIVGGFLIYMKLMDESLNFFESLYITFIFNLFCFLSIIACVYFLCNEELLTYNQILIDILTPIYLIVWLVSFTAYFLLRGMRPHLYARDIEEE